MDTLYVNRKLINSNEFLEWAESQGFKDHLEPSELHVTIAFSRKEVDWNKFTPDDSTITIKSPYYNTMPLGDKGAIVVKFKSYTLSHRWKEFIDGGCSWDYPEYQPHVTICYNSNNNVDLNEIIPYNGALVFGPEIFEKVVIDWDKNKK